MDQGGLEAEAAQIAFASACLRYRNQAVPSFVASFFGGQEARGKISHTSFVSDNDLQEQDRGHPLCGLRNGGNVNNICWNRHGGLNCRQHRAQVVENGGKHI